MLILLLSFFPNNHENASFINTRGDANSVNKIAVLKLKGPILNEPLPYLDIGLLNNINIIYINQIKEIIHELKNEKIKGLIISINSPGGSVSASYNLYNLLNDFSKNNSIDIFFHTNELMASGAYWVASSGKEIYANYGSLIGSIGVRGPDWIYFDLPVSISNGLFGNSVETKNGIKKFNNIAGNSKDLFDSFRAPTKKEIIELQNTTKNIYEDFVTIVSKNRKIESNIIINDIGAMIFESKTAKEKYLIDGIASLDSVIEKMANHLSIKNYQIIERRKNKENFFYNLLLANFISKNNFNLIDRITNQNICNISKHGLSVIFLNSKLLSSC